ncbi:DUF4350 domain-containing protein [Argonema antarcticum]|uniref:DUF4350 domain-containing protein n=1 Tax=Argonema antarcticum TaxID=2942763 RepID=UPI002013B3E8|nr:DUF4350 domain-containing protein [Argonema antarcticum]MCL1471602.1 DUF4350 domain-containing protein [Argonema antarcticum A004/B2]
MKLPRRNILWLAALAVAVIILLTLLAAPQNSKLNSGSTYSRSPDGYGAWYAFMEKRGTPVKRWQKPFADFPGVRSGGAEERGSRGAGEQRSRGAGEQRSRGAGEQRSRGAEEQRSRRTTNSQCPPNAQCPSPMTLLRVNSQLDNDSLDLREREWVERGNTLVILGVRQPVTEVGFSTVQEFSGGGVKIETARRKKLKGDERKWLGDRFGTVVWSQKLGKGQVIYATTPHLAANAYQNEPGNYKFLAQLVTQNSKSIFVDEYLHSYKDKDVIVKEGTGNWITYLAKTPLASVFVQVGVILLVLVLGSNQRLGQPLTLASPVVDNSKAYIEALAGVLQKANSSEFILEVLGKEEQIQLQKALGLGTTPVDRQTLIDAWIEQTGQKAAELEQVLQLPSKKHRIGEQNLLNWLSKWQNIRQLNIKHLR